MNRKKQQKANLPLTLENNRALTDCGRSRRKRLQFALQNGSGFGSLGDVGKVITAFLLLLVSFSFAHAQDQEGKLVERLLRPDMSLQSSAQNRKFIADGVSINKRATVGAFYVQKKSSSKSFSSTRDFSTRQVNSQSFVGTRTTFDTSSRQPIGASQPAYSNRTARGVRDAPQADKPAPSRVFAGNRPFLGQGKSQKALNRKNAPLTIEQVRELLNKNK